MMNAVSFFRTETMMQNPNVFTATGVINTEGIKPTITLHKDPFNEGKWIATFEGIECEEMINGYTYDELLSIRGVITDALAAIEVKETIWEFNNNNPKYTHYDIDS